MCLYHTLRYQMDCIFCKIAQKEVPAQIAHETPELIVIKDKVPQAPIHLLVVPKKHIATINDLTDDDEPLIGKMVNVSQKLAKEMQIYQDGYRLIYNVNHQGGQTVYHIHLHILGGRQMTWPPG